MVTSRYGRLGRPLLATLLLFAAGLAVWIHRTPTRAQAEVRSVVKQPHFKSGGERSEALLREILATLNRMDQRLARLERAATQQGEKNPRPPQYGKARP